MKNVIIVLLGIILSGCCTVHVQNATGRDATRSTPITSTTDVNK